MRKGKGWSTIRRGLVAGSKDGGGGEEGVGSMWSNRYKGRRRK